LRACGDCTLCCKLEGIRELNKRAWQWCQHCAIGKGCRIYAERPDPCRNFRCLWLDDMAMDEHMRPDRAGVYVAWSSDCLRACVDLETATGLAVINYASTKGHVIVHRRHQVNFICGKGLPLPERLLLDWTL
jgi:hypothetical protein